MSYLMNSSTAFSFSSLEYISYLQIAMIRDGFSSASPCVEFLPSENTNRRHVLAGAVSAALRVDIVDIGIRIGAGQWPTPPLAGRSERPLAEAGDRAGRRAGASENLADVLDAPSGSPQPGHLDDGLLYGFPDQLAQFVFHGSPPGMIEHGTRGMPTVCVIFFLLFGRVWLSSA